MSQTPRIVRAGLETVLPLPNTTREAARLMVTLLILAMVVIGVATAAESWYLTDMAVYLAAAEELHAGGNPYEIVLWERGLPYYYHYSPWLAAAFIPLTQLPIEVVRLGWSAALLAASAVSLVPLLRLQGLRAFPLAALMAFLLTNLVAEGNVQPLLLAGLVWTLERRAGPVIVGVAASIKLVPILLALVYVGRGEWRRALLAGAVAGVLLAPALLFEIGSTATETGGTGLFTTQPVLWAISLAIAALLSLRLARSRYGWLAASTAIVLALPRSLIFDVTNLLASVPAPRQTDSTAR
jgi:hypothetical protein